MREHTVTHAHLHTRSDMYIGQGPCAGTNHLLKLLWRSWQTARGRHDFGSHSCPHQPSKMFLGVDPWQPLLLQSSFITVKCYKSQNKQFFCTLTDCQYSRTIREEVYLLLKARVKRPGKNSTSVPLCLQRHPKTELWETVTLRQTRSIMHLHTYKRLLSVQKKQQKINNKVQKYRKNQNQWTRFKMLINLQCPLSWKTYSKLSNSAVPVANPCTGVQNLITGKRRKKKKSSCCKSPAAG